MRFALIQPLRSLSRFCFLQNTLPCVKAGYEKEQLTCLFSWFVKMKFWYPWSVIRHFFHSWTVPETPLYDPQSRADEWWYELAVVATLGLFYQKMMVKWATKLEAITSDKCVWSHHHYYWVILLIFLDRLIVCQFLPNPFYSFPTSRHVCVSLSFCYNFNWAVILDW